MNGLLAAVALLTVLPVPGARRVPGAGLAWFAVAGLAVGGVAAGAWWFGTWVWPGTLVAAVLAVAVLALASGMLHLDGLADVADAGLAPLGDDRERRRTILHDVHHGTFAIVTVALVLLLQVAALSACSTRHGALLLLVTPAAARGALPLALRAILPMPASRMAAEARRHAAPVAVLAALASSLAAAAGIAGVPGLVTWAMVVATVGSVAALLARRFGGLNGDALGAAVEIGQAAGFLAGAAIFARSPFPGSWGLA